MDTDVIQVEISKLELRPGQVLVFHAREVMTQAQIHQIQDEIKKFLPVGTKGWVISGDIDLLVINDLEAEQAYRSHAVPRQRGHHRASRRYRGLHRNRRHGNRDAGLERRRRRARRAAGGGLGESERKG